MFKNIFNFNSDSYKATILFVGIFVLIILFCILPRFFDNHILFFVLGIGFLLLMVKFENHKDKNFIKENFPIFKTLRNNAPNFLSLYRQEKILNELAYATGSVKKSKKTWALIFPEFFVIENEKIYYFEEIKRIQEQREMFEKSSENPTEKEFQKNLIKIYENYSNQFSPNLPENRKNISKIFYKQQKIKMFERFCLFSILGILCIYLTKISNFWIISFLPFGIFIFVLFTTKTLNLTNNREIYFRDGIHFVVNFFKIFANKTPHPVDILLFADIMKYFSENILERQKILIKNENAIRKNYTLLFILFGIPTEIQNFLTEEKKKLKNDAKVVQKIIQKWSEIEKLRLEKERESSQNPLILASNKRREIMMRNLENINKNL